MGVRDGMPFFGRGRPTRRGEVRAAILALLAERPMHGYQVITELVERSGGEWRPSAGSVYPTLQQLADEGLVRDREVDGRRVYELTDEGRTALERSKGATPPWERPGRDGQPDLGHTARGVMSATMQIARDGDAAMQADAQRILTEARRALYRLLADDGDTAQGAVDA
jgi:DNA-binding PadR family transcriptional regulator